MTEEQLKQEMRATEYKGYTINMLLLGGNPHRYFPQIMLNSKWIHEFMWSWDSREKAIDAAKEFIDKL